MARAPWLFGLFPLALAACGGNHAVTTDNNNTSGGQTTGTDTGGGGSGGDTGGSGGVAGMGGGPGGAAGMGGSGGAAGMGGGSGGVGGSPSSSLFDRVLGSQGDDNARGLDVDSGGNAVILGSYSGTLDVDGMQTTSEMIDIFLIKVDTDGKVVWKKTFGTKMNDRAVNLSINKQGQIFVAGSFGDVNGGWGGQTYPGTGPVFAKLAPDGANLWTKAWILNGSGSWGGVVADPDGSSWVTGVFKGTIDFGGGQISSGGTLDPFMAHLDLNGGLLGIATFPGDASIRGQSPDGKGGLFWAGSFKGSLDLGAGALMGDPMNGESFLARMDSSGKAMWSKKLPGTVQRVATDPSGNVLVTGYFSGAADFGTGMITSAGADDVYVLKLDDTGKALWVTKLGSTSTDAGRSIAADSAGNVLVSGFFSGAPDFGMGPLMVGGMRNALLVKLSPDGKVLGAKGFGGDGNEEGLYVAVDSLGSAFVWGELDAPGNYGSGVKTPVGMKDVFLVKAAP